MPHTVFERYPQLITLKGLVPEAVLTQEIAHNELEFKRHQRRARELIKSIKLIDLFPSELEKGSITLENFLGHWGNITIEEVCKIALIVKYFKPKKMFEFGTFNGMTTLQLAINTPPESRIFTIDLPPGSTEVTKHPLSPMDKYVSSVFLPKFKNEIGSYFKNHPLAHKITQLLGDTATFDYSPYMHAIDVIFIDGAHDYANKKSDTQNALRMLAPHGVILWDNYDDVLCPGVTHCLAELAETLPIYHLRGTPLAVYWNNI